MEAEAARHLAERQLTVERVARNGDGDFVVALAQCVGSAHKPYEIRWDAERHRWRCSCPAYPRCAHIDAFESIVLSGPLASS